MGDLARGSAYCNFRAWVPKKKIPVGSVEAKTWSYFDWGRADYPEPVIFLHGVAGSADVFFQQVLEVGARGYRVLSIDIPAYFTVSEFVDGLQLFLDMLNIRHVHLYGAGLGGFLALNYALYRPEVVMSLVLTHTYANTKKVPKPLPQGPAMIKWLPDFVVRGAMLGLVPKGRAELQVALAVEFILARISQTDHKHLAARLALLCSKDSVSSLKLADDRITVIDAVQRDSRLSEELSNELVELFPRARLAYVKNKGEYIYLSDADEVNVHLVVHMRRNAPPPEQPLQLPAPAKARVQNPAETRKLKEVAREDHLDPNYKYVKQLQATKAAFPNSDVQLLASAVSAFDGDVDYVRRLLLDGSIDPALKGPLPPQLIAKLKIAFTEGEQQQPHSSGYIAKGPAPFQPANESGDAGGETRKRVPPPPSVMGPERFPPPGDDTDDGENPLLVAAQQALSTTGIRDESTAGEEPTTDGGPEDQGTSTEVRAGDGTEPAPTAAVTTEEPQGEGQATTGAEPDDFRGSGTQKPTGVRETTSRPQAPSDDDPWSSFRSEQRYGR